MAKNTVVVTRAYGDSAKNDKLNNAEHDANINNLKATADEAHDIASAAVPKVTSTDNAIVRFDGTTGAVKNSAHTISDLGELYINCAGGDAITIEKTTTEPTVRLKGDADTDFVIGIQGTEFVISPNDGLAKLLVINQNGDIGCGMSPNYNLHLLDTTDVGIQLTKAGVLASRISQKSSGLVLGCDTGDGDSDSFILDSTGNQRVIGGIDAGFNGTDFATAAKAISVWNGDATTYVQIVSRDTNSTASVFEHTALGSARSKILSNGSFQSATNSYGALSDERLKENITDTSPKLDKLMQVKVRNFNFIGDDLKQLGVIAQEIEQVFPSLVYETEDTIKTEVKKTREVGGKIEEYTEVEEQKTGETTKNVKYSVLYMMMLKGMQEQQEIINAQEERLKKLEARLDALEGGA